MNFNGLKSPDFVGIQFRPCPQRMARFAPFLFVKFGIKLKGNIEGNDLLFKFFLNIVFIAITFLDNKVFSK
jgi:hypothetical protein